MKKLNLFLFVVLTVIAIFITSCEKYKCIKGSGNIVTESDSLPFFNKLSVEGSFDIEVISDSTNSITIRTDDNIIPYIEKDVVNNELIVSVVNGRCLKSKGGIRIYVYTPEITKAELLGSGEMILDSINTKKASVVLEGSGQVFVEKVFADYFDFILDGSGDIRCGFFEGGKLNAELIGSGVVEVNNILADTVQSLLSGSGEIFMDGICGFNDVILEGSGNIDTDRLDANQALVHLDGSGIITVNAINSLRGSIIGSGIIFYRTLPKEGAVYITVDGSGYYAPL